MRILKFGLASLIFLAGCATAPVNNASLQGAGETAVAANTLFTSDLLSELQTSEPGNIFVSPLSLSTAMGMLQAGAAGETKAQIDRVFRYPETNLHAELGTLRQQASRVKDPEYEDAGDPQITSIANSLWLGRGMQLKSDYARILRDDYKAAPQFLDFSTQPDLARETINDWVEAKTNDRIQDLLKKPNVTPATRLVLVNTVYMMAHWQDVFSESATKPVPFYTDGTAAEPRQLMHQTENYQRLKVKGGEALKIPYANNMSMIVLRPKGTRGLASVNAMMGQSTILEVLENIDQAPSIETDLALPKFRLEARYELGPSLENMGLSSIFTDAADLSAMSDEKDLQVGQVIQQVFLEVNEKGTEAAAATAVTIVTVGARLNPPKPKPFVVDRPFVILIKDEVTGAVMFAGRITNP
jgi:serpin B